jgi:hypothetical protein
MDIKDLGWERKPPEYEEGDYWFNGSFMVTKTVKEKLSHWEILMIYADNKNLVQHQQGIDYLQVYLQKEKNYKLFFIDQVTKESLRLGKHPPEHNYCTLLFDFEY